MKFTIKQDNLKTEFTRFRDLPNGAFFTDSKQKDVWRKVPYALNNIPITRGTFAQSIHPEVLILHLEVCNTVDFKVKEIV